MTDSKSSATQMQRRSRKGCNECRRRHWKCNEAKPSCAYCQSVGRPCVYSRQLSWGGRSFKKSRFGKCLDLGATTINITSPNDSLSREQGFVYGCSTQPASNESTPQEVVAPQSSTPIQSPSQHSELQIIEQSPSATVPSTPVGQSEQDETPSALVPAPNPHVLGMAPAVPPHLKPLLDYFVHGMTISISCHQGIQSNICSTIVPMMLQVPHLMSAVFALAAAHRLSSGLAQDNCQFELMRGKSLKQLGSALNCFNPAENDQVIATTLILCMAEIISPTSNSASWRLHLQGASTLLAQDQNTGNGAGLSSTTLFLRRKYQALQAIAMACGSRRYDRYLSFMPSCEGDARIDDLAGFSTTLLPIFKQINDLDDAREEEPSDFVCDNPPGPPHFDCSSPVEHQSHILFDQVRALLAKREMVRTIEDSNLPWYIYADLYLLDEAYHHMAILQIFRRGALSVPRNVIDESKQKILACLSSMTYHTIPCPAVATLPPLFVAGFMCSTTSERDRVRNLLRTLWVNYGMGNVRACRALLERLWKRQDEMQDNSDPFMAQVWQDEDNDVLPY